MDKGKFSLSLDGGGIRGIFEMQFLKRFCEVAGISSVKDTFGTIAGTSAGGMCALGLAKGLSPDELLQILINRGPELFTYYGITSFNKYQGPVGSATMGAVVYGPENPYIYNNKYPCNSGYDNDKPLLNVLNEILGANTRMSDLSTNVVITAMRYKGGTAGSSGGNIDCDQIYFPYPLTSITEINPVLFSNFISDITEGENELCADVGLATSAASYYFPPVQLNSALDPVQDFWYLDGGFLENNPSLFGYTLAQAAYPLVEQKALLSVGTGETNIGNNVAPIPGLDLLGESNVTEKFQMLPQLLGMSINAPPAAISSCFELMALYNPAQLSYYRFQKQLAKELWPMDNVTNNFPDGLIQAANDQFDKESIKINLFIQNSGF